MTATLGQNVTVCKQIFPWNGWGVTFIDEIFYQAWGTQVNVYSDDIHQNNNWTPWYITTTDPEGKPKLI